MINNDMMSLRTLLDKNPDANRTPMPTRPDISRREASDADRRGVGRGFRSSRRRVLRRRTDYRAREHPNAFGQLDLREPFPCLTAVAFAKGCACRQSPFNSTVTAASAPGASSPWTPEAPGAD